MLAAQSASLQYAEGFHHRLSRFNARRLSPSLDIGDWEERVRHDCELRILEGRFIESERTRVRVGARAAPTRPDQFIAWFESLEKNGPGQGDALFPWLATTAT